MQIVTEMKTYRFVLIVLEVLTVTIKNSFAITVKCENPPRIWLFTNETVKWHAWSFETDKRTLSIAFDWNMWMKQTRRSSHLVKYENNFNIFVQF